MIKMITNKIGSEKMPIYEFRCIKCDQVFEKLFIAKDEKVDISCPFCKSEIVERVVSRINYVTGTSKDAKKPKIIQRSCAGGTCTSIDLPGPSRE